MNSRRNGSSLIELQVGLVLLALALSKTGFVLMNYSRQLGWLESKRSRYAVIAPDLSKVVFSEYHRQGVSDPILFRLVVRSLSNDATAATAVVTQVSP